LDVLTDDGLASLRMAATLALTLPTVRVRISSPGRVLAEELISDPLVVRNHEG
jgi:hypothetical protein